MFHARVGSSLVCPGWLVGWWCAGCGCGRLGCVVVWFRVFSTGGAVAVALSGVWWAPRV